MGRLSDPVHRGGAALPEIDLVQVRLEDRGLVISGLDDQGHARLAQLAAPRALGREEEILHELLCERAAALCDPARAQIGEHRARDAAEVDPRVRLEALVLDREHCVDEVVRHVGEPHQLALLAHRTVIGADRLGLEQHRAH